MVDVNGIQVDIVGNTNSLLTTWAVFTIEFEYDNKVLIGHTFDWSVHRGIVKLIEKILSPKVESIDLRRALINSAYITVEVKGSFQNSSSLVMENKYELIKKNTTYYPYGYNFLLLVSSNLEKSYAFALHNKLVENIDASASSRVNRLKNQRGKASRPVYQYDKKSGLFIREFESIRCAAIYSDISATSINMCCNSHIKSAGGYIWSYEKTQIIELPVDNRKKQITELTQEEKEKVIHERQRGFISKNQK